MKAPQWWFTFREAEGGRFTAWATETPVPPDKSPVTWPGEAHFAFGRSALEARDRLEAEMRADGVLA